MKHNNTQQMKYIFYYQQNEYIKFILQVKQASRQALAQCRCQGKKLKLKKIGEGRYNIHGRNVFIRVIFIFIFH